MGRSTVWTSRIRRASSEWERELFIDGMSPEEVRGALYDVTRTIDHLRISLAAVGQVADSWTEGGGRHQESVKTARQRLSAAVEKLQPIAQDLQAAFYAFEDVARDMAKSGDGARAAAPPAAAPLPPRVPGQSVGGAGQPASVPPGPPVGPGQPLPPPGMPLQGPPLPVDGHSGMPPRSPLPASHDTRTVS
ncbi:MAG: hypothetical protein ACRDT6_25150 [Micromonosporaceae bacterium]